MATHPNRSRHLMTYKLGVYEETADGRKFNVLKVMKAATDAEAESEVDGLYYVVGYDLDGNKRTGVHIRRGNAAWFRQFSAHAGPGSSSPNYMK